MSRSDKRNLAASVRERLRMVSQSRTEPFDLILTRYAIERLLYRLSQSRHARHFVLKGAMLFRVWTVSSHRPTRDIDLLGFGDAEPGALEETFREVAARPVEPDGLEFLPESVQARAIREETIYGGIRVTLDARLEKARVKIQCDIGFGDAITPAPSIIEFPTLLDFPAPTIRSYSIYTVVAEKLEAMVLLGEANSRMKDFYDLWFLSRQFEFDGPTLADAIRATFSRRRTGLPSATPIALTADFPPLKAVQWRAFLRKNTLQEVDLATITAAIHRFVGPPLQAASKGGDFPPPGIWVPNEGWRTDTKAD